MMYRFRPHGPTHWISFLDKKLLAKLDRHARPDFDLDQLEWEVAERALDDDTLRMALRHGLASPTGIVVDAGDISDVHRARELESNHAAMIAHRPAYQAEVSKMKPFYPWILDGEDEMNAELDESIRQSIDDARADVAKALSVPPDPTLVEHWRGLGGIAPYPA